MLVLYFSIVTPFRLAFDVSLDPVHNLDLFVIENLLNALFAVDIGLTFFTGYVYSSGLIEYNIRKIARRYLRSWFIVDFLSMLPLDIVLYVISVAGDANAGTTTSVNQNFLLVPRLLRMCHSQALCEGALWFSG